MTLSEKMNAINRPKLSPLGNGEIRTMDEYWDAFVSPFLPEYSVMEGWHRVLMEYIDSPNATFAIRAYSSDPQKRYDRLRRGFLTHTYDGYSFFFTDNFFSAYIRKMFIDGFVPECSELIHHFRQRCFPARFGRDTQEERKIMALPRGKDPGFAVAGYKISHIVDVGGKYSTQGGTCYSLEKILSHYVPRGEREDWKIIYDENNNPYYGRYLMMDPSARELITAHFLRFVHPINAFLSPKKSKHICHTCVRMNDIGEDSGLIGYIQQRYIAMYGSLYDEFKRKALFPSPEPNHLLVQKVVHISYFSENAPYEIPPASLVVPPVHFDTEKVTGRSRALERLRGVYEKKNAKHHAAIQKAIDRGCTDIVSIPINSILDAFVTAGTIASMCTDGGNSYGRYFHRSGRGQRARICFSPEVWQKLLDMGWAHAETLSRGR